MEQVTNEMIDWILGNIVTIKDFPEPGIMFRDLTPFYRGKDNMLLLSDVARRKVHGLEFTQIAAVESRGFILGAALSNELNIPLNLIRKAGKLPPPLVEHSYALEYGTATLTAQAGSMKGEKVLIVDDVLATGGTLMAVKDLISQDGGELVGALCILELAYLKHLSKVDFPVYSLAVVKE